MHWQQFSVDSLPFDVKRCFKFLWLGRWFVLLENVKHLLSAGSALRNMMDYILKAGADSLWQESKGSILSLARNLRSVASALCGRW